MDDKKDNDFVSIDAKREDINSQATMAMST